MFVDPEFWRQLESRINDKREFVITAIITGAITEAQYREKIGELRMLEYVRTEASDIIKKMNSRSTEHD
ncbi:MAG: hypothetical protein KGL35_00045 [Bradyrhizobium sp.]|nr:hypothetical protein [Bradyrhizobium sp.]